MAEFKVWTPQELGGLDQVSQFNLPAGIGDISWIYSKICHIEPLFGRKVLVYVPAEKPERAPQFLQLLPNIRWGGYTQQVTSWDILTQSVPSDWPDHMGWTPIMGVKPLNIAANVHLEMGNKLATWLPKLPTSYHYTLGLTVPQVNEAENIVKNLPRPIFFVYVSNREKDSIKAGGWSLWSSEQWLWFLRSIIDIPECRNGSFIFAGASWDKDKTEHISNAIRGLGRPVIALVGMDIGVVLRCLGRSNYCFSYPSGIGIMANVLRTPALMLLPWLLRNLETAYADPMDISMGLYKAWPDPKPIEALDWFKNVGMVQTLSIFGNKWRQ